MKTFFLSKFIVAATLISIITGLNAFAGNCIDGSGNITEENRSVTQFTKLILETEATVLLSQDNTSGVRVQADDNLQNIIETEVEDGTLKISSPKCLNPTKTIKIYVSTKNIDEVILTGNGKIIASSGISSDAIKFMIAGNGLITIDELHAKNIYTQITGNGKVTLAGDVTTHTIESTGSGIVHAYKLKAINTKLNITGMGNCEVYSENRLDVRITGNGNVSYIGKPKTLRKEIYGNGKLTSKN